MDTIKVTSDRIGSNPGGKCLVDCNGLQFNGYFKYCHGSRIGGNSSFHAAHQPVYEAITFQLIKQIGLQVTDFYIIINKDRGVQFNDWKIFMNHDPSGRDFYFVSKILPRPNDCPEYVVDKIIKREDIYLSSLLVADIIGKGQNYRCYSKPGCSFHSCRGHKDQCDGGSIVYLDLGCSFVYAREGFLTLPHKLQSHNPADFKIQMHKLERTVIISKIKSEINLGQLITDLPKIPIPTLHPKGHTTLSQFLSNQEIREIGGYLAQSLTKSIPAFKERGLVVNKHFE